MEDATARRLLSGRATVWACIGPALFGIAFGLAFSVFFVNPVQVERPAYVQRFSLSENRGSMPRIHRIADISASTEVDGLGGLAPSVLSDPVEAAGAGLPGDVSLQDQVQVVQLADGQQLLAIDFDLGSVDDRSRDVEISKPIRLNGQELGVANLAIDQRSQLHLSSRDLSDLLPEELFARIDTGTSYIGFDELRAQGLVVRYDPLADVIELVS